MNFSIDSSRRYCVPIKLKLDKTQAQTQAQARKSKTVSRKSGKYHSRIVNFLNLKVRDISRVLM